MDWFGGTFQNWRWGIAWKANWINAERITYKPILKFINFFFLHFASLQNMFFLVLATLRPVRIALQPWFPTGLYACWRDADCWMAWWGASLWHFRLQRPHRKFGFHLTYWFSMAMIVTVLILDSAMTQNPKPCLMSGEACAVRFWHWNFHDWRARLIHYRNLEVSTKQRWLNMNYYLYMIFSHSHFHGGDFTANHVWLPEGQKKWWFHRYLIFGTIPSAVQGSRESVSKARSLIQWCKWGCRNTSANGPIFFSVINLKPSCCQVNISISVDPYPHGHMQKMIFHRMLTCKQLGCQLKLQNGTVIATCNIVSETCKHGSLTIV